MQENSSKPSRQHWSRFSLRTLLVVITVLCVLLGTWIMPSYRQYRVAQQIIADRGKVHLSRDTNLIQQYSPLYFEYFETFGNNEDEHHWYDYFWQNIVSVRCTLGRIAKYDWESLPHLQRIKVVGQFQGDTVGLIENPQKFLATIPHRSQLTTLAITINHDVFDFTEVDFATIEGFTNLETLILDGSHQLTDNDLAHLAKLKHLKNLVVRYSDAKAPYSLQGIGKCRSLKRFVFVANTGPMSDYQFLSKLSSLNELQLFVEYLNGETMLQISKLTQLKHLHLGSENFAEPLTQINDEEFAYLKNLKDLQSLELTRTELNGTGAKYLAGLSRLRSLKMECGKLSRLGLQEIVKLSQVEDLDLSSFDSNTLTKDDLKVIATMTQLKRLNITTSYSDDYRIEPLSTMPNLEIIELSQISEDTVPDLLSMKKLKKVEVHRSGGGIFSSLSKETYDRFEKRNIELEDGFRYFETENGPQPY
jgi:hypothetical protein